MNINFKQNLNKINFIKKRRRKSRVRKIIKLAFFSLFFLFLIFLGFVGFYYTNIKLAAAEAMAGKQKLENSIFFMQKKDFGAASKESNAAYQNFNQSIDMVEPILKNKFLSKFSFINKNVDNAIHALYSGKILSKAVNAASSYGSELYKITSNSTKTFDQLSSSEKKIFLSKIFESVPEMNGINASINLSLKRLKKIKYSGFFWPVQAKIDEAVQKLDSLSNTLSKTLPIAQILPKLSGYPSKSDYLFILQNNDELRPTGGFIGTFGLAEFEFGNINLLETHDIYHLDMPVKDAVSVEPPKPLSDYLGVPKWYMRDSNWSPDFSQAAKKILWFYEKENKNLPAPYPIRKFDGVIAINPQFIIDLFSLTGPIEFENVIYNENNFVRLLQYRTTKGYYELGVPSWERKEVIGEILKIMKTKLLALPANKFPDIVDTIFKNLNSKNIQVYFEDETQQAIADKHNFSGKISKVNSDYLNIIDSNMAALKTDSVMKRRYSYKLEQGQNGLFSNLNLYYKHNGIISWKISRYRTYTRVYVPKGSKLIDQSGFEGKPIIYDELDKTVFAGFFTVAPGEVKKIELHYKLPDKIEDQLINQKKYSLTVQKQSGKELEEQSIKLNFLSRIKNFQPTGFFVTKVSDKIIEWKTDLNTDKNFDITF